MKPISKGYLTIPPDGRIFDGFEVTVDGGETLIDPQTIEGWKYSSALKVAASTHLKLGATLASLDLCEDAEISSALSWRSTGNSLKDSSGWVRNLDGTTRLEFLVPPETARRKLELVFQILLTKHCGHSHSPLSPSVLGSCLWERRHLVTLEGVSSQLPTALKSFTEWLGHPAPGAMWALRFIPDELSAPVESCVWLWLNSDNSEILEYLTDPDSPRSLRLASQMRYYVFRQMLEFALTQPDFDESADYEEGTFGAALRLQFALADLTPLSMRQRLELDRPMLEVELEAKAAGI
jgi:hypothetical protein